MNLSDLRKDYALEHVRELQPLHPAVTATVTFLAKPWLWIIVIVGTCGAMYVRDQMPFVTFATMIVPIGLLVAAVLYLERAVAEDHRALPPEALVDPELRRAIQRVTRNGGRLRAAQREVIDNYMRVHYGRP